MKKGISYKCLLLFFVLCFLCAGSMAACSGADSGEPKEKEEDMIIKISGSGFIEGEGRWQRFLEAAESGRSDKITIEAKVADYESTYDVEYREGIYYFKYSDEEQVHSYKYLLELEGVTPGSGLEDFSVVLANEVYDYDEFFRRFSSSHMEEKIDCKIILSFVKEPD